jgi:BirA family biotin operon repressor/biotin-[acetyl-CoA-carboxylase] ligase
LSASLPAWRIEAHDVLASTQDLLRERLEAGGDVRGLVIRAAEQTAGRGQRARDWQSGRGGSWQSVAVPDEGALLAGSPVTLAIAVGLTGIFAEAGVSLGVKWPNDLLLHGRKVAGILCEIVRGHLLAGVGMNVSNAVPPGAVALQPGSNLQLAEVHELVLAGIRAGMTLARADRAAPGSLAAAYASVDALAGQRVEVSGGKQLLTGVACGIDRAGSLQLLPAGTAGTVVPVRSGRVRILNPAR